MSRKKNTRNTLVPAPRRSPALRASLLADVRSLIDQARDLTARAVNSALVLLYWTIGTRIRAEILRGKRADYGKQILGTLSQELARDYGKGYTYDNLTRMMKLAEVFPDKEIVVALSRQLGWSHYLRWLDKHEREPDEQSPLGLILCESAGAEQVELLQLGESGIRVATYLTELPPKALIEQKLHAVAELARERFALP